MIEPSSDLAIRTLTMSEASFDIVRDILSRLPAKSLLRLRSVCKAWKNIIDDPFFVKSHTKNHRSSSSSSSLLTRNRFGGALHCLPLDSLNYDADRYQELDVIPLKQIIHRGVPRLSELPQPSCNGLILITHYNIKKSWAIWNPLLQDFHLLPPPETGLKGKYECFLARRGFGYDERSDDYKVVRVDRFHGKGVDDHCRTRVYSLRSCSWRTIDFPGGECFGDIGAFLDGALHWRSRDGVVALDLGGEVHRLVVRPPPRPNEGQYWESLDALDGCLIWSYGHQNLRGMDAWVMEDYGTTEKSLSWTKLFSIETNARCLRIVAYLKSKGQVLLRRNDENVLKWLDLEKKCWRDLKISSCDYNFMSFVMSSASHFSFAQFSPVSLVRLDNHNKNRREGVKRKREKVYTKSEDDARYPFMKLG